MNWLKKNAKKEKQGKLLKNRKKKRNTRRRKLNLRKLKERKERRKEKLRSDLKERRKRGTKRIVRKGEKVVEPGEEIPVMEADGKEEALDRKKTTMQEVVLGEVRELVKAGGTEKRERKLSGVDREREEMTMVQEEGGYPPDVHLHHHPVGVLHPPRIAQGAKERGEDENHLQEDHRDECLQGECHPDACHRAEWDHVMKDLLDVDLHQEGK